jgi:hypothetical protein
MLGLTVDRSPRRGVGVRGRADKGAIKYWLIVQALRSIGDVRGETKMLGIFAGARQ